MKTPAALTVERHRRLRRWTFGGVGIAVVLTWAGLSTAHATDVTRPASPGSVKRNANGKADAPGPKHSATGQSKAGTRDRRPARASLPEASAQRYADRPGTETLAREIAERQGLDARWVLAQIHQARHVPAVARLIMPPPAGTAKNWAAYRARFVEPARVAAGATFWDQHARWLEAAQTRYGVPAEVVIGILGVETYYGRLTGHFRVLDALTTLSLDFPSGRKDRSAFFREELGEFLKLAHSQGFDPTVTRGSFAGAIGLGQFMPGSINRYAVDFDEDGHVDMAGNAADVIGSIAHYLASHGWQAGMPTHFKVQPPAESDERARLLAPDILPSWTAAQMNSAGAELEPQALSHAGPMALVELQNGGAAPSYVAGTTNFYAVTRYNWSAYYAMAVIDLGNAVAARRAAR